MFIKWMRFLWQKEFLELMQWSEKLSAVGRERMMLFFRYGLHVFRESLVMNYANSSIQMTGGSELAFISKFSPYVNELNAIEMVQLFEEAEYHISRNANPRILIMDVFIKNDETGTKKSKIKMGSLLDVKVINKSKHDLPKYATLASAGLDVRANIDAPITINSLERVLVKTGIFMELPVGYEAQVRPRSGLAFKHGITVLNSPGTIDADYRGEVGVVLVNLSKDPFVIQDGERIAQLVIAKHEQISWKQVESLEESDRGAGGFGSTGKS